MLRSWLPALLSLVLLAACGGAGNPDGTGQGDTPQKLVGEIFSTPAQIDSAEIRGTAGYSGNLPTSRAIQAAGRENLLDLLFVLTKGSANGIPTVAVPIDAEKRLVRYASDNADLLLPGVRVLVHDEVYWHPEAPSDRVEVLQQQLEALQRAVALVRKHMPRVRIGITVSPYATFGRPNTLEYVKKALPMVDWVGTDPYWLGDASAIAQLHDWSRSFHALAKQAHPGVETWYIAQAFRLPEWHLDTFSAFITEQLGYAEQYDHILFFGWQFVSEIDIGTAGMYFAPETKQLYRKYLK